MRTVFLQGTFDICNAGHVRTFKWLHHNMWQRLGEKYDERDLRVEIVIGLNTDELVSAEKPGQPIIPYEQRREILEGCRYVSRVIPCDDKLALKYLKELDAHAYALTKEWETRQAEAIKWMQDQDRLVVFTPYYPDDGVTLSCSSIRAKIRAL